ncbi:MAG TPA: hypothetical protein VFB79_03875 [Candidatus Angelobacter sp.]|nr:hypothetical protein [Candidatus Angelobacter sp.]
MAQRKASKEDLTGNKSGKNMSEGSPNPHGENKVIEMPITTDQRNATGGRNIPQVPNTTGGKLNPSVAHDFENRVVSDETKDQTNRNTQNSDSKKEISLGKKKKDN